jgi:hypothetical protein
MRYLIILALAFSFETATAQNLGDAYDWLKYSYKKIPMKSSQPYYDTSVVAGNNYSTEKLTTNARYFAENVLRTEDVADLEGKGITVNGSYELYTNETKDEEHTYTVNYKMDIQVKAGKYSVAMHDFNIFFLNNKVEFGLKYKGAKGNDGKSNQFMALFHNLNEKQIKKLCETMSMDMLPADATASK